MSVVLKGSPVLAWRCASWAGSSPVGKLGFGEDGGSEEWFGGEVFAGEPADALGGEAPCRLYEEYYVPDRDEEHEGVSGSTAGASEGEGELDESDDEVDGEVDDDEGDEEEDDVGGAVFDTLTPNAPRQRRRDGDRHHLPKHPRCNRRPHAKVSTGMFIL